MQDSRSRKRRLGRGLVLAIAGCAGVGVGLIVGLAALFFGLSTRPDANASTGAALLGTRAATPAGRSTPNAGAVPDAPSSASPEAGPAPATPSPPPRAVGTPAGSVAATPSHGADPFTGLTLEQKVGQLFMLGFDGSDGSGAIAALIQRAHAGNVLILPQNVRDPLQLRELTDVLEAQAKQANGVGLLVAADQEGGEVQALPPPFWAALPAASELGAGSGAQQIVAWGQRAGNGLLQDGVNVDLAPALDVNGAPPAGIGTRAFGTDPAIVSGAGLAFAQGLRAAGVIAAVTHFPGLGGATRDPRTELPVDSRPEAQLRGTNLPPFADAVRSGAGVVLVGDGVYPAWDAYAPALFSQRIVGGLLRGELGYQGVVMTDDLAADAIRRRWSPGEAAVKALQAGADLLLISGPAVDQAAAIDAVLAAVREGRIPEAQIDASAARVLALKLRYGVGR